MHTTLVQVQIASAARNYINSAPQTAATTITFSSVFILPLWIKLLILIGIQDSSSIQKIILKHCLKTCPSCEVLKRFSYRLLHNFLFGNKIIINYSYIIIIVFTQTVSFQVAIGLLEKCLALVQSLPTGVLRARNPK